MILTIVRAARRLGRRAALGGCGAGRRRTRRRYCILAWTARGPTGTKVNHITRYRSRQAVLR